MENEKSLYSEVVINELQRPYDKALDSIQYSKLDPKIIESHADFNADWESEYIHEEGKLYKQRLNEKDHTQKNQTCIKETILEVVIQEEQKMDRVNEILATLNRIENNQYSQQQYLQPPVNNYIPHYTKPWTKSDLTKVGAYSSKPSEAQKVYAQCAAKQDRAWAASLNNQAKWKK